MSEIMDLKVINPDILTEAKQLMNDRFPMMIKYFLEDAQMYMEEIGRGIQEKNIEVVVAPAHTIKSSARQLGIERVSSVAKNIEELARGMLDEKEVDFQQISNLYSELSKELDKATPELNRWV